MLNDKKFHAHNPKTHKNKLAIPVSFTTCKNVSSRKKGPEYRYSGKAGSAGNSGIPASFATCKNASPWENGPVFWDSGIPAAFATCKNAVPGNSFVIP